MFGRVDWKAAYGQNNGALKWTSTTLTSKSIDAFGVVRTNNLVVKAAISPLIPLQHRSIFPDVKYQFQIIAKKTQML